MSSKTYLPALTGVRFLLALWVIVFHLSGKGRMLDPFIRSLPPSGQALVAGAWAVVGVFFVLSGFVLARSYASTDWNQTNLVRYGVGRLARVYPVYLLSLAIVAPIIYHEARAIPDGGAMLANYGLVLQGWSGPLPVHWNTPAWTLSCELFFYVCFPAVALLFRNRSLAAAAMALALPVGMRLVETPAAWKPFLHLGDFLMGIAAAGLYDGVLRTAPRLQGRGHWFYAPAMAISAALLIAPQIITPWMRVDTALRPLNAILIVGLALGGGLGARALSTRAALLLGKASYSMYILHIPLLWWFKRFWIYKAAGQPQTGAAMIYMAIVVAVSAFVFEYVEEPANRWIRRLLFGWLPALRTPVREPA